MKVGPERKNLEKMANKNIIFKYKSSNEDIEKLMGSCRAFVYGGVEDFGIGFYTKYGDGGVDISPIADLLKSEVFSLAKFYNIIGEIIDAEPNDGLWSDNRSDEDQIGASYDEIEKAMINSNENGNLSQREKEVLKIYRSFNTANKHKMDPIPVCKIPKKYL